MLRGNHACVPQLLKPGHLEPMLCNRRRPCKEGPCTAARERPLLMRLKPAHTSRPRAAEIKTSIYK